ncbi:MAG: S49 family peptidase, partial [Nitrospirales bacterium]
MELANMEGLLKKIGVESVVIKSGKHKDLTSPFKKMTEQERRILQHVLDDVHRQFIEAVAEGRSLDIAVVQGLADGRIFTGRQAKEVNLVDDLGDLETAIDLAAEMAGIEGKPTVVEPERPFSLLDLLQTELRGVVPRLEFQPGVSLKYLMAW